MARSRFNSKRNSRGSVNSGSKDRGREDQPHLDDEMRRSEAMEAMLDKDLEGGRSSSVDLDRPPQIGYDSQSGWAVAEYTGPTGNKSAIPKSEGAEHLRRTRRESFNDPLDDFQCVAGTLDKNLKPGDLRLHHVVVPAEGRPLNFGEVMPGVYRSSYPQTDDYSFLQKLGLKTVVTLVHKEFPAGYKDFLNKNGIKHHVFDMAGTKKVAIPPRTMNDICHLIADPQNHPMLIHCNHGRHRTGCVVAVVRKMSGWQMTPILEEYKSYAEPKIRDCDLDYIQAFDVRDISNYRPWFRNENRARMMTVISLVMLLTWFVSQIKLAHPETSHLVQQ